jgi:A/G-specific adenine glycosylase
MPARSNSRPRSRGYRLPAEGAAVYAEFSRRIRRWFRVNGRALPWRETRDPYRVLVSELMLQQTQVARVIDRYGEFLERFPTLDAVAASPQAHVMEAWEGLGYYARARNLHRLAQHVAHERGGEFPSEPSELRRLPGVGAYTAGAVASFAFERRAPLVDTNVARVLKRVFAPRVQLKTAAGERAVWTLAERALPRDGRAAWAHNQGVMELGALVCTARASCCAGCPVQSICATAKRRC